MNSSIIVTNGNRPTDNQRTNAEPEKITKKTLVPADIFIQLLIVVIDKIIRRDVFDLTHRIKLIKLQI